MRDPTAETRPRPDAAVRRVAHVVKVTSRGCSPTSSASCSPRSRSCSASRSCPGTMVLTDTIKKTFDELFADVYGGTDAYVRSARALISDFGEPARGSADAFRRRSSPRSRRSPGVAAAEGNVQFYAQLVDKKGDAIGNPRQGAPTFGFDWETATALNPYRLEPGGQPPQRRRDRDRHAHRPRRATSRSATRSRSSRRARPKEYTIVGIAKFGDADSPPARPSRCSHRRGAGDHRRRRPVRRDRGRGRSRRLPGNARGPDRRQARQQGVPGDHRRSRSPRRTRATSRTRSSSSTSRCWSSPRSRCSSARSSSSTRSRSSSRNGCGSWRCSAPSAPAAVRCCRSVLGEAVVVGLFASVIGLGVGHRAVRSG